MRIRCDPADVMGPWPGREAPALAGGDVLEGPELRPSDTVAKDEQATRFRAGVERPVRRADRNGEDVPLGQLDVLPSRSAVAAEERAGALRADDHAVAIGGHAASRDALEHGLNLSRLDITVEASHDTIAGADESAHGGHPTLALLCGAPPDPPTESDETSKVG